MEEEGGAMKKTITSLMLEKLVAEPSPPPEVEAETLTEKEAILAVLRKAAEDSNFLAQLADDPQQALEGYNLTSEEKAALASGDIRKVEAWVGKLDERLSTWLWCRLQQEKF